MNLIVTVIVAAALSSAVLTASITGLINLWVSTSVHQRKVRAEMIRRWRYQLGEYLEGSSQDITTTPIYAEIRSVLRHNGVQLDDLENPNPVATGHGFTVDLGKRAVLDAIARLARKWGLD